MARFNKADRCFSQWQKKKEGIKMTQNQTITMTLTDAKEMLRLLEYAEYALLSERDKEMLDFRQSAIKLRKSISESEQK